MISKGLTGLSGGIGVDLDLVNFGVRLRFNKSI
jgi:hypothetical protein